jgi:2-methylisocitrate lyase-like PEP mutase family enzyme
MINLLEGGKTPILPLAQLEDLGFSIASYPLSLLGVSIQAMQVIKFAQVLSM